MLMVAISKFSSNKLSQLLKSFNDVIEECEIFAFRQFRWLHLYQNYEPWSNFDYSQIFQPLDSNFTIEKFFPAKWPLFNFFRQTSWSIRILPRKENQTWLDYNIQSMLETPWDTWTYYWNSWRIFAAWRWCGVCWEGNCLIDPWRGFWTSWKSTSLGISLDDSPGKWVWEKK